METINIDPLRQQLSKDWDEILMGLQENGLWGEVTVEIANQQLGNKLLQNTQQFLVTRNLQAYRQAQRFTLEQLRKNHVENLYLFNPSNMKIIWSNIKMKTYEDNGQLETYCSKGAFLCRFLEGPYPYGFFYAKSGYCGFRTCLTDNCYGTFYVGTWDDLYLFSLTDKYRKIMEEEGFTPKEKLV